MNDVKFVSAQPDVPYFHWQVEIYVNNFIEKGVNPKNIHVLFSINDGPSKASLSLKKLGINVYHYLDEREKKHYIPSIKPFLIYKWLSENSRYTDCFFLHDADIVFRVLPDFKKLMNDDIIYLSDTIGYIGYNYIMDCCNRYEQAYDDLLTGQLLREMASVVQIKVDKIKDNQPHSGGGQYLIKNTHYLIWKKIYQDSTILYDTMINFQKRYPISTGQIQFWTAEMWSLLWNLWFYNKETRITPEMDFSWATDTIDIYEKKPILHMAGVTEDLKDRKFYKGDFININPISKLKGDIHFFDYIEESSSTKKYIDIMKKIIN